MRDYSHHEYCHVCNPKCDNAVSRNADELIVNQNIVVINYCNLKVCVSTILGHVVSYSVGFTNFLE